MQYYPDHSHHEQHGKKPDIKSGCLCNLVGNLSCAKGKFTHQKSGPLLARCWRVFGNSVAQFVLGDPFCIDHQVEIIIGDSDRIEQQ